MLAETLENFNILRGLFPKAGALKSIYGNLRAGVVGERKFIS
jgi:hypothetical protein